ncbi:MAG: Rieske (2Fe-2S) protein [Pseudonocardia sp.]|nr:Rieske (2Fe-2S) protein [Pseudonocardia sp.]
MTAPTERSRGGRHVVARTDEIPPGSRRIVELDGRQIGIFNIDGEYVAFLHRCPHMSGPLCEGQVIGLVESSGPGDVRLDESRKFLTCPLHGWEFDVHTGQSYFDPKRVRAKRFPVEVRSGADVAAEGAAPGAPGTPEAETGAAPEPDGRVPGPYTAETFEVTVERGPAGGGADGVGKTQDYVVVSTGRPRRT